MTKNIIISIFVLILIGLFAMKVSSLQYSPNGDLLYSKADCIKDIETIAHEIYNTHPAPFDYISKTDFDYIMQSQMGQLNEQNTLREFHWIARKLIATIGCGHTALTGQNEERKISDSLHFPLDTKFIGNQLYITQIDDRYPALKTGIEIININNQSVESILHSMIQRVSSDGLNDAYPKFYINREVDFFMESHFKSPPTYNLILADSTSVEITAGTAHNNSLTRQHSRIENLLFDTDFDNDLAIMTIRSFNYYGPNYSEFENFVEESMEQLRDSKINNLIIDIRGNGGGDPLCANLLLRYISKKPYQYFHESINGYPELKKKIHPFDNVFQGKTYMIIDGGCGSTSGHLSSLVKYNNTATLVGQTSGATYKCHDNSANVTLPNTKLNLHIARHTFQTAVENMNMSEGVKPDIIIEKSLSDWAEGSDIVIDSIYQIIRSEF